MARACAQMAMEVEESFMSKVEMGPEWLLFSPSSH